MVVRKVPFKRRQFSTLFFYTNKTDIQSREFSNFFLQMKMLFNKRNFHLWETSRTKHFIHAILLKEKNISEMIATQI